MAVTGIVARTVKLGGVGIACRLKAHLDIYPPDRRKRDIDNAQKCLLDAMEKAQLYLDDNQIKDLHSVMREPVKGGKVIVTLEAIEEAGQA